MERIAARRAGRGEAADEVPRHQGFHEVADLIGCKWTLGILDALDRGINRPGRLQRALPGLTPKVLGQRMRKLQRYGLIERHAYGEVPPRVEYAFTERGQRMRELLTAVRRYVEAGASPAPGQPEID